MYIIAIAISMCAGSLWRIASILDDMLEIMRGENDKEEDYE